MTNTKITTHALFFAVLSLICSCGSKDSMKNADKSRLATGKYDFSHDADLASVNAHTEEAQVQETQKAALHWKQLLNLMGDHSCDTTGDSLYQDARHNLSPALRLVSAKVTLARYLHLINQLKLRFASDRGLKIVDDDGGPISIDSSASAASQEAYADLAILKETVLANKIDQFYTGILTHSWQQPKLPPVPPLIRKLFGR